MEINKSPYRSGGIFPLPTQQRRLRHFRSLSARNVQLKTKRTMLDVTQLQMFFTLHKDANSNPFYTSEKIRGSLNPAWKTFSLVHVNERRNIDTTGQSFIVQVWHGQTCQSDTDYDCCIRWVVHLSGLVYLGSKILNDRSQHAPNTLIFGFQDGFYGAPENKNKESDILADVRRFTVDADLSQIRQSYSTRSLMRVQTVLRAIKQTQRGVMRERRAIKARLQEIENLQRRKAQRELALLKVNMIRSDLQWRITQLQGLQNSLDTQQMENIQREISLRKKCAQLVSDLEEQHERKKRYFDFRDELIKTGAQLVLRRKQLLSELAFIYPIQRLPNSEDLICGVHLPHSEDFPGHDETQIAVALGYTCHLVLMISNYLDIPLRYPMDHSGSRSMIHDHIIDKLSDKERDFPLFSKGKEKFQFQYGVFILNKNVAQLRHYCGMTTKDLRQTLANISTLLCDKLGVTFNRHDAFSNQHSLIPPSFGGPQKSSQTVHPHNPPAKETSKEMSGVQTLMDLRVNQADPRLEEIKEESGELSECHSNGNTATELLECSEQQHTAAKDQRLHLLVSTESNPSISSLVSFPDSDFSHCSDESQSGVNLCSHNLESKDVLLRADEQGEDFPNLQLQDKPSPKENTLPDTTGTPCADDLDVVEDKNSLLYQSHFGKWEADMSLHMVNKLKEADTEIGDCYSDAVQDGNSGCDAVGFEASRTFKTWGSSTKEWNRHWTNDSETDDHDSMHAEMS